MENQTTTNQTKNHSGFGTAALVLGIIGAGLSFIPIINNVAFFLGILAVAFAIVCFAKKSSTGVAVAGIVLGLLSIIITIVMQASAAKAISDATSEFSNSMSKISDSMDDLSGNNTEDILKNNLEVELGKFKVEKGFINSYELPVKVKNKGAEQKSFMVQIEAVDGTGARITSDTVYVNNLNGGQSQELKAFQLVSEENGQKLEKATFKILKVSMV